MTHEDLGGPLHDHVALHKSGDAFAAFFSANWSAAHRLASLVGAEDPEDVAQEAFSRMHRRFDQIDQQGEARAYLNRTICNLTTSRWRRIQTAVRHRHLSAPREVASDHSTAVMNQTDLADALAQLSTRQREVLVLRYWLDLPESEIAGVLRITPGSVKSHASRGIQQLRLLIAKENENG